MHAETLARDAGAVRWVIPDAELTSGRLRAAPGSLGELLATGVVRTAIVEPHGVVMWLAPGRSWRTEGEQVRRALTEALGATDAWEVEPDPDGVLRQVAEDVMAGPVGDYVRSHGGGVRILDAHDGVLELEFEGACSRCPASGQTLHSRLETAIRERFPGLQELHDTTANVEPRVFPLWPRARART